MTKADGGRLVASGVLATAAGGMQTLGIPVANFNVGLVFAIWGAMLMLGVVLPHPKDVADKSPDQASPKVQETNVSLKPDIPALPVQVAPPLQSAREKLIAGGFRPEGGAGQYEKLVVAVTHKDKLIQEWDLRLFDNDTEVAAVRVINVHSDCAWAYGSSKSFAYFPKTYCPLQKILKDNVYRERLALARNVVIVGLDSFAGTGVDEDGIALSAKRASALAVLVDRVHPNLRKVDRIFWTLDLGRSQNDVKAYELPEFQQRSVVILGVDLRQANLPLKDVVRLVTTSTTLGSIDLASYNKSATAVPRKVKGMSNGNIFFEDGSK